MNHAEVQSASVAATWHDYLELTKPRVVALIVLTSLVGSLLATPGLPRLDTLLFANLGIALAAAGAAAINHVLDRGIDARMTRTQARPLPTGRLKPAQALYFALALSIASMLLLVQEANVLTAVLSFVSLLGYAVLYTVWLKRATPQNIVIGGAAGAAPPVLGWTAVTGHVAPQALLLFLIIFIWTPPHFWSLAAAKGDDYRNAGIPMLPLVAPASAWTLAILAHAVALFAISLVPLFYGYGLIYGLGAGLGGAYFVWKSWRLHCAPTKQNAMANFFASLIQLGLLIIGVVLDGAVGAWT
jgi:protoheme IX farnesyltransferase